MGKTPPVPGGKRPPPCDILHTKIKLYKFVLKVLHYGFEKKIRYVDTIVPILRDFFSLGGGGVFPPSLMWMGHLTPTYHTASNGRVVLPRTWGHYTHT